ncbi:MAG TPA: lamin tail domain-containing protein [Kofleriaceae bacterium]|jgi:hypothetical protein
MRQFVLGLVAVAACGPTVPNHCTDTFATGDLVITEVFADYASSDGTGASDDGHEWFELYNNAERAIDLDGVTITSTHDGSVHSHVMRSVILAPEQYFVLGNAEAGQEPIYVSYGYGSDLGNLNNDDGGTIALACGATQIDSATFDHVKAGHSRELTDAQPPDSSLNDDTANWCNGEDNEFDPGNFGTPGEESDCQPIVVGQCTQGGTPRDAVPPRVGDLVITEVMPKPAAVSETLGQWFEVVALSDVDLNGVGLDRANDADEPETIDSADCVHMQTGDYAVFARSANSGTNGGLTPRATFTFSLDPPNAADVQLTYGDLVIDSVTWTAASAGKSLSLDPTFTDSISNDDPANFCDGDVTYNEVDGITDSGTPGVANPTCATAPQPGQCTDLSGNVRTIISPLAGTLVISEFLPNPAGTGTDSTQEWFELANVGSQDFDLNGLSLKGNAATVNTINATDCKTVRAGGYALFAHSTDPAVNGGLPTVDATFTFALAASNGSITVSNGATTLDAITWTTPSIADGISRELVPSMLTSTANDDPDNFCNSPTSQTYGSAANYGTPRAANACQ